MQEPIEFEDIAYFEALFDEEPANRVALNAVTQNGLQAAALNREVVNRSHHSFSHLIKTPKATDQKASGRCWLFAGLNALRLEARRKLNLKKFELSQTYLMFWDKLEKANFFLESILETLDEPLDGRLMMWLLLLAMMLALPQQKMLLHLLAMMLPPPLLTMPFLLLLMTLLLLPLMMP